MPDQVNDQKQPMRIAIDAMGGDKGPQEVTRGVIDAARNSNSLFLIVGDPDVIRTELQRSSPVPSNIEIIPA